MRLQQTEVDKLKWISSLNSINKGKKQPNGLSAYDVILVKMISLDNSLPERYFALQ